MLVWPTRLRSEGGFCSTQRTSPGSATAQVQEWEKRPRIIALKFMLAELEKASKEKYMQAHMQRHQLISAKCNWQDVKLLNLGTVFVYMQLSVVWHNPLLCTWFYGYQNSDINHVHTPLWRTVLMQRFHLRLRALPRGYYQCCVSHFSTLLQSFFFYHNDCSTHSKCTWLHVLDYNYSEYHRHQ